MKRTSIQEGLSAVAFSLLMIVVSLGNAAALAAVAAVGIVVVLLFRGSEGSCPLWVIYASYLAALIVSLARLLLFRG